jgi:hypothetical protein
MFLPRLWIFRRSFIDRSRFSVLKSSQIPLKIPLNTIESSLTKLKSMSLPELKALAKLFGLPVSGRKVIVIDRLDAHWRNIGPNVLTAIQCQMTSQKNNCQRNVITEKMMIGLKANNSVQTVKTVLTCNTYLQYKQRTQVDLGSINAITYEVKLNGHGVSYRSLVNGSSGGGSEHPSTYRSARHLPLDPRERVRVEMRRHLSHRKVEYVNKVRQQQQHQRQIHCQNVDDEEEEEEESQNAYAEQQQQQDSTSRA